MEWRRKSEVDEMYCAVHNADCELHGYSGDPMVLCVNPGMVPSAWVCPQALFEMEHHLDEAERYKDENAIEPAGLELDGAEEELLSRTLKRAEYGEIRETLRHDGPSGLSLEQIDGCIYALQERGSEDKFDAERAEDLEVKLIEFWEGETEESHE